MASMPPGVPGSVTPAAGLSSGASFGLSFIANLSASYILGRFTGQNGPRLDNLEASEGDYGTPLARGYGYAVRVTGAFIAQADIKETTHKIGSKGTAAIVGAVGGAAAGFMIGGPVGAAIGAAVGGLLGFSSPNQYYYTYSDTFACFLLDRTDDDPVENVLKIWAGGVLIFNSASATILSETFGTDGKLIKRKYKKNKFFASLTIYGGHTEQDVDPILAAEKSIDEDGGYVYSALAVIEALQLEKWGNSVPATEYLVQAKSGQTLADAIEQISRAAGIDSERDISTTAMTSSTLRGYLVADQATCWDAIRPLLPAFAADAAEVSGQVRLYRRTQTMRATITIGEMGAHIFGDTPPEKFMFQRATDIDLPKETSLTFIDPDRDYQPNTMTSRRSEGSAKSNISTQISLVLSADEGATAAALMHWDSWLGRTSLQFSLTDAWNVTVGLAYGIPVGDEVVPYRISRRLRGANGITECEAISDESVVYSVVASGSSGLPPDEGDTEFADTRLVIIDGPITEDAHDDYGFYIAMAGTADDWPRGLVQASGDGGATWADIFDQPLACVMGTVALATPAGLTDGLDDTLDTTTTITVVLLHDGMVLEDATDAELDAHANMFCLGSEYMQFKTQTKIAAATYELTNLRRGRRGTDWALGSHSTDEDFVMFGDGGIYRIVYTDTSQWGVPIKFRGVTLHQDEVDAAIVDFTNTGEGKRPFSPVNVEGSWDGSYNLDITWDSRSRLFAGGLGIDDNAEWDIEITNATPVRSATVTAETYTYTAADQVTDGLIAGQVVEGRVRQTSDVNDGRWRDFTLVGPLSRTADTTLFTADDTTITADMG